MLLTLNGLFIWGVYCPFSEGYVLHFIAKNLEHTGLPRWLSKPLYGCPPCMSSFYGIPVGLIVYDWTWVAGAYVICLCGLNYIVKSILFPEYE